MYTLPRLQAKRQPSLHIHTQARQRLALQMAGRPLWLQRTTWLCTARTSAAEGAGEATAWTNHDACWVGSGAASARTAPRLSAEALSSSTPLAGVRWHTSLHTCRLHGFHAYCLLPALQTLYTSRLAWTNVYMNARYNVFVYLSVLYIYL